MTPYVESSIYIDAYCKFNKLHTVCRCLLNKFLLVYRGVALLYHDLRHHMVKMLWTDEGHFGRVCTGIHCGGAGFVLVLS